MSVGETYSKAVGKNHADSSSGGKTVHDTAARDVFAAGCQSRQSHTMVAVLKIEN